MPADDVPPEGTQIPGSRKPAAHSNNRYLGLIHQVRIIP